MKVCIVGGGASGMMASVMLARRGANVSLLEKNSELGKKILITGKGRCNLTNVATGEEFLANVVRGKKFLISAERKFSSQQTIKFFEELGVKLKVERGGRVFPESDSAKTINSAFKHALTNAGVEVITNFSVKSIVKQGDKFTVSNAKGDSLSGFDACVIATGGVSYPGTGSTGDGYDFAKAFGHSIISIKPALNGIETVESVKHLEGLTLKNVKLRAFNEEKQIFESEIGEMLFTAVGVSGPLVLTASSFINRSDVTRLSIDFKPALIISQLEDRIDREIKLAPSKQITSLLSWLLPKRLVPEFLLRLGVSQNLKLNQMSREIRSKLIVLLKDFTLTFRRVEDIITSVITSGGVSLDEINPKDMSSKRENGLYFIGEVLDCDALTGGFNLQIAFMTANACANSEFLNCDGGSV